MKSALVSGFLLKISVTEPHMKTCYLDRHCLTKLSLSILQPSIVTKPFHRVYLPSGKLLQWTSWCKWNQRHFPEQKYLKHKRYLVIVCVSVNALYACTWKRNVLVFSVFACIRRFWYKPLQLFQHTIFQLCGRNISVFLRGTEWI